MSKILIVDDEPVICDLVKESLIEQKCECISAYNAEQALQLLRKNIYDLLLLDIKLPGISGLSIIKEIRQARPQMPIIIITGLDNAETAVQALKSGADEYLVKPFEISVLVEKCLNLVGKPRLDACADEALDAIALGVKMKIADKYSSEVLSQTAQIATRLMIPEKKIQDWVKQRKAKDVTPLARAVSLIKCPR